MQLSVIIVNYNVKFYLEQCLCSLCRAVEGIEAEVIVVDNHSKDGSVAYLKPLFPSVRFVQSSHNLGFARANNMAVRQSRGDYVLLLNPDTIVGEQVLMEALDFMENHSKAGAVGVSMLKADGKRAMESRRGIPTPMTAFYKMVGLCKRFPENSRFAHYYMGGLPWDSPQQIEVVSGAFCLLRREALFQAGLLDEDYFMYGEDIELSYQLLQKGWQNWYLPLDILHYKGESTEKSSFRYVHVFYKAMLVFMCKHYTAASLISIPVKAAIFFKAFTALVGQMISGVLHAFGLSSHKKNEANYVFVGKKKMLDECRLLAESNDLRARFVAGNPSDMPDFLPDAGSGVAYIVYDTETFDYAFILKDMVLRFDGRCSLGTYRHGTLITAKEVIRYEG